MLSRHNVSIWKAALRNVENLPACPIDMSEPQYAALVFDRHCFVSGERGYWDRNIEQDFQLCGSAKGSWVDYGIRLRLCTPCYKIK